MSKPDVDIEALVIGGANVDIFGRPGEGGLRADSTPGRVWEAAGGVGRNIAANLARLGHLTRLLGIVGNDPRGDWLLQQTRQAGVDVAAVRRHDSLPTASYLVMTDSAGEARHAIADMRAMDDFGFSTDGSELALIERCRLLVIDCNLPVGAIDAAIRRAAHAGVPVFVDGVSSAKVGRVKHCLDKIHTLKVNRLEGEALAAIDAAEANWADRVEARLLRSGVQRVVISLGAAGIRYADARHRRQAGVDAGSSSNDTGAGDALMAGLVSAWLRDLELDDQLRFALGCAALTLQSDAANHPQLSIAGVNQWLKQKN